MFRIVQDYHYLCCPNDTGDQRTLVKRPNIAGYVRQIIFFLDTLWTRPVAGNRDRLGAFSTRLKSHHMQSFERQTGSSEHFFLKNMTRELYLFPFKFHLLKANWKGRIFSLKKRVMNLGCMYLNLRLTSHSLCSWGWSWTSDLPLSNSSVLGLQLCDTTAKVYVVLGIKLSSW